MEVLEGPQIAEVEDRSEVDEEALATLPGEHLDPTGQGVYRGRRQGVVVGR